MRANNFVITGAALSSRKSARPLQRLSRSFSYGSVNSTLLTQWDLSLLTRRSRSVALRQSFASSWRRFDDSFPRMSRTTTSDQQVRQRSQPCEHRYGPVSAKPVTLIGGQIDDSTRAHQSDVRMRSRRRGPLSTTIDKQIIAALNGAPRLLPLVADFGQQARSAACSHRQLMNAAE